MPLGWEQWQTGQQATHKKDGFNSYPRSPASEQEQNNVPDKYGERQVKMTSVSLSSLSPPPLPSSPGATLGLRRPLGWETRIRSHGRSPAGRHYAASQPEVLDKA